MRAHLTAVLVGVMFVAGHAATSRAADYYGVPTWTPRTATGVGRLHRAAPGRGVEVSVHREIYRYPESRRVPPVMGYEYLYDRNQARTVGGYVRMFNF